MLCILLSAWPILQYRSIQYTCIGDMLTIM